MGRAKLISKKYYMSKTFWFNFTIFSIGLLDIILKSGVIQDRDIIMILTGLSGILLRFKTDKSIKL